MKLKREKEDKESSDSIKEKKVSRKNLATNAHKNCYDIDKMPKDHKNPLREKYKGVNYFQKLKEIKTDLNTDHQTMLLKAHAALKDFLYNDDLTKTKVIPYDNQDIEGDKAL